MADATAFLQDSPMVAAPSPAPPAVAEGGGKDMTQEDVEQLEFFGMPQGTPIWIEGVCDGVYMSFKRKVFGANEHTIMLEDKTSLISLTLRDRHWRVPGGVPGAKADPGPISFTPPAAGVVAEGGGEDMKQEDVEQLEFFGMPQGTPIWVEGIGEAVYMGWKRKVFGANEHTIMLEDNSVQTLQLRDMHWRVPGGVPGAAKPPRPAAAAGDGADAAETPGEGEPAAEGTVPTGAEEDESFEAMKAAIGLTARSFPQHVSSCDFIASHTNTTRRVCD
jgi:hypothetical protein